MKTIKESVENIILVKNSKFITILTPIQAKEEWKMLLEEAKEKYPKATHYIYAYRIIEEQKASDDNEPTNTAGLPTLNILEKENLQNICAITIRYFGGIKLGVGGLIRAYTESIQKCLEKGTFIELEKGLEVELTFSYEQSKEIDYILKNNKIISKEYQEQITYIVQIPTNKLEEIKKYQYSIKKELYIEKV